jgi:hypothetical protein
MSGCTAPKAGHRTASGRENCPVCRTLKDDSPAGRTFDFMEDYPVTTSFDFMKDYPVTTSFGYMKDYAPAVSTFDFMKGYQPPAHLMKAFEPPAHLMKAFEPPAHLMKAFEPPAHLMKAFEPPAHLMKAFEPPAHLMKAFEPPAHLMKGYQTSIGSDLMKGYEPLAFASDFMKGLQTSIGSDLMKGYEPLAHASALMKGYPTSIIGSDFMKHLQPANFGLNHLNQVMPAIGALSVAPDFMTQGLALKSIMGHFGNDILPPDFAMKFAKDFLPPGLGTVIMDFANDIASTDLALSPTDVSATPRTLVGKLQRLTPDQKMMLVSLIFSFLTLALYTYQVAFPATPAPSQQNNNIVRNENTVHNTTINNTTINNTTIVSPTNLDPLPIQP